MQNFTKIFENRTKICESTNESATIRSGVKFYMDIVIYNVFGQDLKIS